MSNTLSDQLDRIATGINERADATVIERAQYGAEAQHALNHIADVATRRPDGEALLARVSMLRRRVYIECLGMPDRSQPVPTPPDFGANCCACGRRVETSREPLFPGPRPWTYTCSTDACKEAPA